MHLSFEERRVRGAGLMVGPLTGDVAEFRKRGAGEEVVLVGVEQLVGGAQHGLVVVADVLGHGRRPVRVRVARRHVLPWRTTKRKKERKNQSSVVDFTSNRPWEESPSSNLEDVLVESVDEGEEDERRLVDDVVEHLLDVLASVGRALRRAAVGGHQQATQVHQPAALPTRPALNLRGRKHNTFFISEFNRTVDPLAYHNPVNTERSSENEITLWKTKENSVKLRKTR